MDAAWFRETCARVMWGAALVGVATTPARAQTFVEVGAGWNFVAPAPFGDFYRRGYDVRVSAGRHLSPRIGLRLDLSLSEFPHDVQEYPPCAFPGCTHPYYNETQVGVAGVSANVVANVDRSGLLYVLGGAGVFDLYHLPASLFGGLSFGAGISVPVHGRFRAFVEADDHIFFGAGTQPPWIVPLSFGIRY